MKTLADVITAAEATAQGYKALTTAYDSEFETKALNKVMADMDRGKIDYVLVGGGYRVAVWRKGMKTEKDIRDLQMNIPSAGRVGATTIRKDAKLK